MGFFSHVQKGDKVKHSTSLENAKRDLVNSFKGIATVQNKARPTSVPVYNASDSTIPSYSAVTLVRERVLHDMIPVAATSTSLDTIFGITLDAIEPGKIGSAVIEGIATAKFTIGYKSHRYAVAGPDGILESADAGPVMLCGIYDEGDTEGLVRLSFEEAASKAVRARIISGSAAMARATAIRCCSPPENCVLRFLNCSLLIPTDSNISSARVRLSPLYFASSRESSTFSTAVS